MFIWKDTVRIYDTDAAGLLFFANQFRLINNAFDEFMNKGGFRWTQAGAFAHRKSNAGGVITAVVHAESDYISPLAAGDQISIEVKPIKIGKSSFHLSYLIKRGKKLVGKGQTVHACLTLDKEVIPIPSKLKKYLKGDL